MARHAAAGPLGRHHLCLEDSRDHQEPVSYTHLKCWMRVERTDNRFTSGFKKGDIVQYPIAHHEGLYFLPPDVYKRQAQVNNGSTPSIKPIQ